MRIFVLLLPLLLIGQSMTVYKDNIALVKEPVQWDVLSGVSEITYDKLPDGVIPNSPFLMLEDAVVHYQRFNNDVFRGNKYFRGKIGEYVYVKVQNNKDRKSTRLNSSHIPLSRMPSSA